MYYLNSYPVTWIGANEIIQILRDVYKVVIVTCGIHILGHCLRKPLTTFGIAYDGDSIGLGKSKNIVGYYCL